MIREIPVARIREAVETIRSEAAYRLPADYLAALEASASAEPSPIGRQMIELLLENSAYAQAERIATCQDTGMALLFLEVGQDVHFSGGDLRAAIQDGMRSAYAGLRKSVAWPELGTEAIHELTVEDFPAIVINGCHGGDAYAAGRARWEEIVNAAS